MMASPHKKLRLSPKTSTLSPRLTQDSRITSTPKRSTENVVSPSFSTISSSSGRSMRKRLSDVFEAQESNSNKSSPSSKSGENDQTSVSSRSFTTPSRGSETEALIDDYDAYFDETLRIKYTGTIWELYKPLNKHTLYAKILDDPCNTQDIVTELFMLYNQKPQKAVLSIIQFCVDVAGFQNYDVSAFSFKDNDAKVIIDSLEEFDKPEIFESTGRYLLMEPKTDLAKTLKMAIYNFINKLILTAHDKCILYEETFSKNVCSFLKCMSFSNLKAVRHTGVVIGMKILTALVITCDKINRELKNLVRDPNISADSTVSQKREQLNAFNNLLEYFYFIFIKNYHIQDSSMIDMRIECLKELQIWMKLNPKMFITNLQAVDYQMKMIIDRSKDVRFAALVACEGLLKSSGVVKFLEPIKQKFCDTISKRFYDIDYKVAVKAIDIFTIMLRWDEHFISADTVKVMTHLVFDNIFPIGAAACRFLVTLFQEYTPEATLEALAKIYMKQKNCIVQLLVEGFLHTCPEIQNWTLYCKVLLTGPDDRLQLKEAISDIFSEAVSQTLTGKSSKMRVLSRTVVDIESTEYQKIANCFPSLNKLLQMYGDHPKVLISLLKIFPLVNTNIITGNYCEEYSKLSITNQILFDHHTDEDLLNKIAEALFHFRNVADFAERACRITETLGTKHTAELNTFAKRASSKTCLAANKVAILYAHMDLNAKFTWEILSESCSDANEQTAVHLMTCCAWFLIWNLRSMSEISQKRQQKELPGLFILHNRTCNEFTDMCFKTLEYLKGQPFHFKVYECLCDFFITYSNELGPSIKFNKQFEDVRLRVDDKSKQNTIIDFLDKHILVNKEMSLGERRKQVVRFVDLVHVDILPITVLSNVFKLYHVNFKEYGPIIESSLKCMADDPDENTILFMIIHTLASCFEDILKKHHAVDINTEEAKHLQLLVKQFLKFEYFRSPKRHLKKLLYFSIKYAFKIYNNYAFLYYAKYFIDLLFDVTDQKEVFDFFKKNIPRGAEKNDAVLYFANYMKSVTNAAMAKSKTKDSTPVSTKDKENRELRKSKGDSGKRGWPKKPETPSKKKAAATSTPKNSKSFSIHTTGSGKGKKKATSESNIEMYEETSIHDSESGDEIDRSLSQMRL
ncbi:unnamed protein product [Phaedon cochleariae]|uniref:Uncharacterized protein n=1 Tax=Phaedon cochleariae TaxID=80249 RepID=A0A9P0GPR9_PHACE|nr:unnamed protein product [Phaedon cochleariae]